MTPERLNELAEMIEHDEVTVKEGREIAAYLRECAKAEPVATVCKLANGQHDIAYKTTDLNSLSVGTKLYPAPQVLSSIDERAEFEKWANENKGGEPLQLGDGGTYPNPFANAAFEAWQARAKLEAQQPASVPYWFTFPRQPNDGTGWTVDVKYIDYVRERCVEEYRPSEEEVESVLLALELSRFGPQQPAKVTQETAVVPDELKEICGLIARIFFYGNFVAETYNERELEKLLRKNGYFAESEDELMEIIQRLPSRNA